MKSTRRHELQQNTLQDELARVGGWFKRHFNAISWGLLAVAVAVVLVLWLTGRKAKVTESIHRRYVQLQSQPAGDEQFAELFQGFQDLAVQAAGADDTYIAAGCWVQAGNLGLHRLVMTDDLTDAQRADLVRQTRRCYETALSEHADQVLWAGKARLGLGRLAESVEPPDLEAARSHYTKLAESDQLAHTPLQWAAQEALQRLEADRQPVRLAAAVPPEPDEQVPAVPEPEEPAAETPTVPQKPEGASDEAPGDEAAPEEPVGQQPSEPPAEPANGAEPAAEGAAAEEQTDLPAERPADGADDG